MTGSRDIDQEFWAQEFWATCKAVSKLPRSYLLPLFGDPATPWFKGFAWLPVRTDDRGWRWLTAVSYRRVVKHNYLDGGASGWWQYSGVIG